MPPHHTHLCLLLSDLRSRSLYLDLEGELGRLLIPPPLLSLLPPAIPPLLELPPAPPFLMAVLPETSPLLDDEERCSPCFCLSSPPKEVIYSIFASFSGELERELESPLHKTHNQKTSQGLMLQYLRSISQQQE